MYVQSAHRDEPLVVSPRRAQQMLDIGHSRQGASVFQGRKEPQDHCSVYQGIHRAQACCEPGRSTRMTAAEIAGMLGGACTERAATPAIDTPLPRCVTNRIG